MRRLHPGADFAEQFGHGQAVRHGLQRFRQHARRQRAGRMAAGAVGDCPESDLGTVHQGILVGDALRARVGRCPGAEAADIRLSHPLPRSRFRPSLKRFELE
jgi:hypothetical protein